MPLKEHEARVELMVSQTRLKDEITESINTLRWVIWVLVIWEIGEDIWEWFV